MAAEPSEEFTALGRELERTVRRLDELETLLRQLAADIAPLIDVGRDTDLTTSARAWLLAEDPDQARADLADLTEWVGQVYLRYPGGVLPSCWLWHPAVIEELWWLRQAHAEAYHPSDGSPSKAADWHDRQRPGVTRRLHTALGDCELSLHEHPRPVPTVPLAGSADRIATTWITHRATPAPTPQELADADHHDRIHQRTTRP